MSNVYLSRFGYYKRFPHGRKGYQVVFENLTLIYKQPYVHKWLLQLHILARLSRARKLKSFLDLKSGQKIRTQ